MEKKLFDELKSTYFSNAYDIALICATYNDVLPKVDKAYDRIAFDEFWIDFTTLLFEKLGIDIK